MARDYYEVLGVNKTSSQDEIKVAYRKLAIECHPDRCPGDKEAEERFKEAAEAYNILCDPDKRKRYDMFGHEGVRGVSGQTFGSYDDIFAAFGDIFGSGLGSVFGDIFGTRARPGARRQTRGASLRCNVTITFEEAARGVEKTILLKRAEKCENCSGSGAKPGTSPQTCSSCGGQGDVTRSQGFFTVRSTCPKCGGRGEVVDSPCSECSGSGLITREREISVRIPAGIEDGSRLRIPGEGEPGDHGGPNGDLYCFIETENHQFFQRRGDDLLLEVPISFSEAALGTHIDVPTLKELRSMKVPPGTQSGTILRLRGAGFPNVHGYGQGDQLVRIFVEVPKKLKRNQQKLIKQLQELDSSNISPQKKQYLDKLNKFYKDKGSGPSSGEEK